jgi:hypothetical protein
LLNLIQTILHSRRLAAKRFHAFRCGLLLLSLTCLLVGTSPVASSCECFERPHRKDFRQAKAIFIGKVVAVEPNSSEDEESRLNQPYAVRLVVERRWKGPKASEITVLTRNRAACGGFEFSEGQSYLVYAFGDELVAFTACTRSGTLEPQNECITKQIQQLNSFWFRLYARLIPF